MELLTNGTPVYTGGGHTFGTDALLLARFALPRTGRRAVDLCSGCGIVALEWYDAGCRGPITAVELDEAGSALCAESARQLAPGAILPLAADLRRWAPADAGLYDLVACNPPYFAGGPRADDPTRAAARHTDSCTMEDVAACAARLLRDGGRLTLCHKPDQLAAVFAALQAHRLEPKRIRLVRSAGKDIPWLFLLEAQKNRKPGLVFLPELVLSAGGVRYGADFADK